jgi:hypothetical protein
VESISDKMVRESLSVWTTSDRNLNRSEGAKHANSEGRLFPKRANSKWERPCSINSRVRRSSVWPQFKLINILQLNSGFSTHPPSLLWGKDGEEQSNSFTFAGIWGRGYSGVKRVAHARHCCKPFCTNSNIFATISYCQYFINGESEAQNS